VFEEQGRLEAGGFDMFVSVVASVAHTMIIHCLADKRQCSTYRGRVGGLEANCLCSHRPTVMEMKRVVKRNTENRGQMQVAADK
jgi:hypothetical protein